MISTCCQAWGQQRSCNWLASRCQDSVSDRRLRWLVRLRCSLDSIVPMGTEDHQGVSLPQNTDTERG